MFARQYFLSVVIAVLGTEAALLTAVWLLRLEPDIKVGIAAYTATPLFIVGLMELRRNLRLQRAAFIKDYVSKFFTDQELYRTFHDLIYTYDSVTYKKMDEIRIKENLERNEERPLFRPFESLQRDRPPGSRFYHPRLFQGSPEERRLDALMGYFDVLGYYYAKGFLRIEDIAGSVGYFLAVIRSRDVVKEYMKMAKEAWRLAEYQELSVTPPFGYLRRLLDDIDIYNRTFASEIARLQEKRMD